MARPVVWVTGPGQGGLAAWWFTRFGVWRAGGRALRVVPNRSVPAGPPDALILGGGADVGPIGEKALALPDAPLQTSQIQDAGAANTIGKGLLAPVVLLLRGLLSAKQGCRTDSERDRMEEELLENALQRETPILGICRGMQLLNLVFGGTLHEEVEGFYSEVPQLRTVLARKRVSLQAGSRIAAILGADHAHVNALHHQAVDSLGNGLRASAVDAAGVIQTIETKGDGWLFGVQWHPEYLPQSTQQRRLFRALVRAANRSPGGG